LEFDLPSKILLGACCALALGALPARSAETPNPAPAPAAQTPAPSADAPLSAQNVERLRRALDQAAAQGLQVKALIPPQLDALLASHDPDARRRGEALLQATVLRYAKAVHAGQLSTKDFDDEWAIRPAPFDPRAGLQAALAQDAVAPWLDSLAPHAPGYQLLVKQLAVYRDIAAKGGWAKIPGGHKGEPGAADSRAAALRTRLAIEDSSAPIAGPDKLDPPLVEALKAFQRRHGLVDDGELGPTTVAVLNVPVERRIDQIVVNLERWRWLPDSLPAERVVVNIPGAMATLIRDGKETLLMKTAPGRKDDHTPMLQSQIDGIVLDPPWNIPKSIADKEIYPKQRANPGYFAEEQIEVIHDSDGSERLQQKAGDKSSLGRVKFEFDNRFGVYLHDTPVKAAFDRASRMVSHGCVRLEKPRDLAAALLDDQPAWSAQAIDAAIDTGDTKRVALAHPVGVFLFYWTAFVGADGRMNFMSDPYDWDQELMVKLSRANASNA
jgi:murein L,D-transpeptidase YcbB/YkuD